jgi:hypothetical protein
VIGVRHRFLATRQRFLSTIVPMNRARQTSLSRPLTALAVLALTATLAAPGPAAAWSPGFQTELALEAARLAPPDLARQIERHREDFADGVMTPFSDRRADRHVANPDGTGSLQAVIEEETEKAVEMIRSLAPFDAVVHQLGVVAHYVADAHNPLNASDADGEEARASSTIIRRREPSS